MVGTQAVAVAAAVAELPAPLTVLGCIVASTGKTGSRSNGRGIHGFAYGNASIIGAGSSATRFSASQLRRHKRYPTHFGSINCTKFTTTFLRC